MTETLLHSRSNTGLTIELHYGNDKLALSVIDGNYDPITFPVNPENAFDAFYHPFFYMPKSELEALKLAQRNAKLAELED